MLHASRIGPLLLMTSITFHSSPGGLLDDPDQASYTFEKPCPDTSRRINALNLQRTANGEQAYTGATTTSQEFPTSSSTGHPEQARGVHRSARIYALTQLSVFEDKQHANELLVACDYI